MAHVAELLTQGNGSVHIEPTSRRAFLRSAPPRIGHLEDQVERQGRRLNLLVGVIPRVAGILVRLDALAEENERLRERVRLLDGRSKRSRRKVAVLADQVQAMAD